jgi:hypothetical protein
MKNLFLVLCLIFLSNISVVHAEFKFDVSNKDIEKSLKIISISDLTVGDSAYISLNSICIKSDGNLAISRGTHIETERNDYSTYALIKVEPGGTLSVELISSKKSPEDSNKKAALKKFLSLISQAPSCDFIKTFFPLYNKAVYSLSTIEGMESFKGLLEMYLKMK